MDRELNVAVVRHRRVKRTCAETYPLGTAALAASKSPFCARPGQSESAANLSLTQPGLVASRGSMCDNNRAISILPQRVLPCLASVRTTRGLAAITSGLRDKLAVGARGVRSRGGPGGMRPAHGDGRRRGRQRGRARALGVRLGVRVRAAGGCSPYGSVFLKRAATTRSFVPP